MLLRRILPALALAGSLHAQDASDLPLGVNLPTAQGLEMGDLGIRFTHRFAERARGNGYDAYGLDGYAFAGVGLDFSFKALKGWNLQLYRTADQRTFTVALQRQLFAGEAWRAAARLERYDEVVRDNPSTAGLREGKVGTTLLVPLEVLAGPVTVSLVPAYLNRSATQPDPIVTAAAAVGGTSGTTTASRASTTPAPGSCRTPAWPSTPPRGPWSRAGPWATPTGPGATGSPRWPRTCWAPPPTRCCPATTTASAPRAAGTGSWASMS